MTQLSDLLVRQFFRFQDELKLYHWRTEQYARHKAADSLYATMQELIDQFIEAYMGIYGRVKLYHPKEPLEIRTWTDKNATNYLKQMTTFLHSLDKSLKKNSALLNIRDEMVSGIEQTIYLFSLH